MTAVAKCGFLYKPEGSEAANKVGVAAAPRFRRMCCPVGGKLALGDGGLALEDPGNQAIVSFRMDSSKAWGCMVPP